MSDPEMAISSVAYWLSTFEVPNGWVIMAVVIWAAAGYSWGYSIGKRSRHGW